VDETIELQLLFANKTEEDIILKKELDQMIPRVRIDYLVEKPTQNWEGLKGIVTTELL
jgi:cytochrome-b5 reductase